LQSIGPLHSLADHQSFQQLDSEKLSRRGENRRIISAWKAGNDEKETYYNRIDE